MMEQGGFVHEEHAVGPSDLWSLPSTALGQYALHYRNTLEGGKSLLLNEDHWMGAFQSLTRLLKYT